MKNYRSVWAGLLIATAACSPPANGDGGPGDGMVGETSVEGGMDATPDVTPDAPPTEAGDATPADGSANGCTTTEQCDGLDNDCDGMVDEGVCPCAPGTMQPCYVGPPSQAGRGPCTYGTQMCMGAGEFGSWGACTGSGMPRPVTCTGMDDLCTGVIDVGCTCPPGMTRPCYTGTPGTQGVGLCRAGTQTCEMTMDGSRWGSCSGQVLPEMNRCDGVDRACTGDPNAGCCTLGESRACYTGSMETRLRGECRDGMQRCILGSDMRPTYGPCTGDVTPRPDMDPCDALDLMCTGMPRPSTCDGCTVGQVRSCYGGPMGTAGVGVCRAGTQTCAMNPMGVREFGPCMGEVRPTPMAMNTCDGPDVECTGRRPMSCGVSCMPGATQACYSGPAPTRGVGRCRAGTQTCAGMPPAFGVCAGEVVPAPMEICGNSIDDDCDGMMDEGCRCTGSSTCYGGPSITRNRGACRDGNYVCRADGTYDTAMCIGQVLPTMEICDNHIDDDCDGFVDCETCISTGMTPWQIYRTERPVCYGRNFAACGFPGEFDAVPMDRVPPVEDTAWRAWPDPLINFGSTPTSPDRMSRLTAPCTDRNGGDFTYFQTYFYLRENPLRPGFPMADDFRIRVTRVNNAIRATLYNTRFPIGASINTLFESAPTCDMATIAGDTRVNMADLLAPGLNRIVITHLDDATPQRELTGVQLLLGGIPINVCTGPMMGM